ncbi:MAG TPA: hypothetical protein VJB91_02390 [Patescibacteria group bacterium]|nr:hypothetical protein [Patescibacteria group bacterium]
MPEDVKESEKISREKLFDFIQRIKMDKRAILYCLVVVSLLSLGVIGLSLVKETTFESPESRTGKEYEREYRTTRENVSTESALEEQKDFAWSDFQNAELQRGYIVYTVERSNGTGEIKILYLDKKEETTVVGSNLNTINDVVLTPDKNYIYYADPIMTTIQVMKFFIPDASYNDAILGLEHDSESYWSLTNLSDREIFFSYSTKIPTTIEESNDPYSERRRHRIYKVDTRGTPVKPNYEVLYEKEIDSFPSTPLPIAFQNNILYLISYGFEGPNKITAFNTKTKEESDTGIVFDLLEPSLNQRFLALEIYSEKDGQTSLKPAIFKVETGEFTELDMEGISSDCLGGSWGPRGCFILQWAEDTQRVTAEQQYHGDSKYAQYLLVTNTRGEKRVYDTNGREQDSTVTSRILKEIEKQGLEREELQKLLESKYGDSVYLQGYKLE